MAGLKVEFLSELGYGVLIVNPDAQLLNYLQDCVQKIIGRLSIGKI